MPHPVILLHAQAPPQPAPGAPCNGCGVCCAWQPCPLGMLASGRRTGPCAALRWDDGARLYRCAVVDTPASVWPGLPTLLQPALVRLARRWIAAGAGCDCTLQSQPAPPPAQAAPTPEQSAQGPGQPVQVADAAG